MNGRLRTKFLILYGLLGVASFLLISTLGSHLIQEKLVRSTSSMLYKEAVAITDNPDVWYDTQDSSLETTYYSLKSLAAYQNSKIWILDPEGSILLDTSKDFHSYVPKQLVDFDPLALGTSYYSTGNFFGAFDTDMLSVMVPVTSSYELRGYLAIHTDMNALYRQRESILSDVYVICGIMYLLFCILLLFLSLTVDRPLKSITQGAKEYAAGNLTYHIPIHSQDEMGYLASTLNYMSDALNESKEYQRKFIANVSHDFRSPLTSIKGYVEAIQDGTILPEMQGKYLDIVLFETDRLNKLTQGMLTLNSLDHRGQLLDLTSFDINAVIKNTVASFEGICRSKMITIELLLASHTLYVLADMEKIQQVLYNLIDNAVKFSGKESLIQVETTERHGKVFVSVKDNGIGIPRDSLNKVWDRFYKTDSSRGKDRKGTGLGLSIVKEIITAHNQKIDVISTEGVGTEFIFSLNKATEKD